MKLLIVDTDRHQVEMLTNWLKTQGYEVCRAYTGEQARQEWLEQQPDLVIIDPSLQDMDGLVLCREMAAKHDALILISMAGKDVQDEIRCLEGGADDYLQKPFFPGQLLAHLHAVTRRGRPSLIQRPAAVITVGTIRVDSLHNEVIVDQRVVRLTPIESKLLHLLAINVNNVCTSSQIVAHIWGFGNDGDAGLIKAHIRHLRQKIERDPAHPVCILTVPGVGYTLACHGEKGERYTADTMLPSLRASSF